MLRLDKLADFMRDAQRSGPFTPTMVKTHTPDGRPLDGAGGKAGRPRIVTPPRGAQPRVGQGDAGRPRISAAHLVPPAGFEPAISTLKGWRPRPLDDGGGSVARV